MIPCDRCAQRPATRVIAHPTLGHPLRLCESCAQQLPAAAEPTAMTLFQVQLPAQQSCPRCGTAFQAICQNTVLGCSYCYTHYRVHLESLVQRVQGANTHRGKFPLRQNLSLKHQRRLSELKEQLREAVQAERYELAAELRDQIQQLTQEAGEDLAG